MTTLHPDDIGSDVWHDVDDVVPSSVWDALSTTEDINGEAATVGADYLGPDTVADYAHLNRCDQFYKYDVEEVDPRSGHDRDAFDFGMSPVMAKDGEDFERAVAAFLTDEFPIDVDIVSQRGDNTDIIDVYANEYGYDKGTIVQTVDRPGGDKEVIETNRALDYFFTRIHEVAGNPDATPLVFEQLRIGGVIGAWPLAGVADLVFVWGTEDGVRIHVIDLKSSHEEKPRHQIQVACYTTLLR